MSFVFEFERGSGGRAGGVARRVGGLGARQY